MPTVGDPTGASQNLHANQPVNLGYGRRTARSGESRTWVALSLGFVAISVQVEQDSHDVRMRFGKFCSISAWQLYEFGRRVCVVVPLQLRCKPASHGIFACSALTECCCFEVRHGPTAQAGTAGAGHAQTSHVDKITWTHDLQTSRDHVICSLHVTDLSGLFRHRPNTTPTRCFRIAVAMTCSLNTLV